MVRIDLMADRILRLDRRKLLAGLAATAAAPALPSIAAAQARSSLALQAKAGVIALRPGAPDTPIWTLGESPGSRFKRGETLEVTLGNGLPIPAAASWRGIDGVPAAEPLAARAPLPSGAKETLAIPLRHAGTFLCDFRLLGDGQARPSPARALIVGESEPVAVDRDEVLLIEDWRLRPDGTAIAPGIDAKDTVPLYTINGLTTLDIPARANQRLRLRFINGCQRASIAVKIEGHDVWVMALDGQPAEPFLARGGALVLAPGTRVDAFVDATAAPGSVSSILLHDGKEARPIARLVTSGEPPVQGRAAARCRPAALQWPARPARPQERLANRPRARRTASRLGDACEFSEFRRPRLPHQGGPHCRAGPDQPRRRSRPCSISMAIISACSIASTMAGSRSGWIRWQSIPGRPSGSPLPPNSPVAG